MATRYTFSGHESFYCKSLWLKKGYDAVKGGAGLQRSRRCHPSRCGKEHGVRHTFLDEGLRALHPAGANTFRGLPFRRPFLEDTGSLLLHYSLVRTGTASIYPLTFLEFRREKREFDRDTLQGFIKRKCGVPEQRNVYNENTVAKDIRVMLQTYVSPADVTSVEDFSSLLIDLGLIRRTVGDRYCFCDIPGGTVDPRILLYAVIDSKGDDATVSFDMMQDLCLVFGLSVTDFILSVREMEALYPGKIVYTDNAGFKNIQFIGSIDRFNVLDSYYNDR